MNKERQNYLKIQDLEATIIKFGEQKNRALEELEQKEEFFRREMAQLQEGLSHKDIETIESSNIDSMRFGNLSRDERI